MIGFQSSILAGTVLVRSAIRSPNYVAGVSGWTINQDGSVEFNNAVIRGSIIAGGGTVRLDAGGVKVDGTALQFDINFTGGFLARRLPDDGAYGQLNMLSSTPGATSGGGIFLNPTDPTANGNTYSNTGSVYVDTEVVGAVERGVTFIRSPIITGKTDASLRLRGQSSNATADDSKVTVDTHLEHQNLTGVASTGASFGPIAAETLFLSTVADWLADSAYLVKIYGRFQPTNTTTPRVGWNIRQTNTAGAILCNFGRQTAISAEPYGVHFEGIFTVGASTINRTVLLGMYSGSAPGVNNITALAPFLMEVYWMGSSANYPDQSVIT